MEKTKCKNRKEFVFLILYQTAVVPGDRPTDRTELSSAAQDCSGTWEDVWNPFPGWLL